MMKPAILTEETAISRLGTVRSREFGVQKEGCIRNWETLMERVGDSRYTYKAIRNCILSIRESEMPIVAKMKETTKLFRSQGALVQVVFSKKGVFSN
jgi:hypothetical protein